LFGRSTFPAITTDAIFQSINTRSSSSRSVSIAWLEGIAFFFYVTITHIFLSTLLRVFIVAANAASSDGAFQSTEDKGEGIVGTWLMFTKPRGVEEVVVGLCIFCLVICSSFDSSIFQ
jgi:hypothetical protein